MSQHVDYSLLCPTFIWMYALFSSILNCEPTCWLLLFCATFIYANCFNICLYMLLYLQQLPLLLLLYGNSCAATFFVAIQQILFGSSCCSFAELNDMQTSLLSSPHLSCPLFSLVWQQVLLLCWVKLYADLSSLFYSPLFSSLLFSPLFSLVWQQQLLLFWFK